MLSDSNIDMYLIDITILNFSCVPLESDTSTIFLSFKMMIIDANMNWIKCRINASMLMVNIP